MTIISLRTATALMLAIAGTILLPAAQATPTYMATYGAPGCTSCHTDGTFTKAAGQAGLAGYLMAQMPSCTAPQILQNNVCVTPEPVTPPTPTCTAPQILQNNICVTPEPVTPTCYAPQILQNNVCITPEPVTPTCYAPQILQNNICITPEPVTPQTPTCRTPQILQNNVCVTPEPVLTPAEKGKLLSVVCSNCHGNYGISADVAYPNINGQDTTYFVNALQHYKDGQRRNTIMQVVTDTLSEQDMQDLAAYYAENTALPSYAIDKTELTIPLVQVLSDYYRVKMTQSPDGRFSVSAADKLDQPTLTQTSADAAAIAKGKILSSSCSACHGKFGLNINSAANHYPHINGQQEDYIFNALQQYQSGQRNNVTMQALVGPLSTENMHNLAAFYASNTAIPSYSLETGLLTLPFVQVLTDYYRVNMEQSPEDTFSLSSHDKLN